jgi:hypothetical protein
MLVQKKNYKNILIILEPCLNQNYHVFQDNYYNSVKITELLLSRQLRVCETIGVNRGLPPDLKNELKSLKRCETTFRRKGEVLLQTWRDTRVVNMITTIHTLNMVDIPRRNETVI